MLHFKAKNGLSNFIPWKSKPQTCKQPHFESVQAVCEVAVADRGWRWWGARWWSWGCHWRGLTRRSPVQDSAELHTAGQWRTLTHFFQRAPLMPHPFTVTVCWYKVSPYRRWPIGGPQPLDDLWARNSSTEKDAASVRLAKKGFQTCQISFKNGGCCCFGAILHESQHLATLGITKSSCLLAACNAIVWSKMRVTS